MKYIHVNSSGYAQPENPTDENGATAFLMGGAEYHIGMYLIRTFPNYKTERYDIII